MSPVDRAELSLAGLTIGDAFGQRFFIDDRTAQLMAARRQLPDPPWRMTDDSIMAIAVVDILRRHGRIDRDALAERFAQNYARDPLRGYGPMAHQILRAVAAGGDWSRHSRSAFGGQGSFGNGAAMRIAPLGVFHADDPEALAEQAVRSAEVTHSHPDGKAGAVAIAAAAAWAWNNRDRPADGREMIQWALDQTPEGETKSGIARALHLGFDAIVEAAVANLGNGSRISAADTVPFVLWCAGRHLDDYETALWTTVGGLGDRDTTCAMVGGIVACRVGWDGIPQRWLAAREPLDAWRLE